MRDLDIHPWEPEETVGKLWHRFITREREMESFPEAAVQLDEMRSRIGILFRGLGGRSGTEIIEATESLLTHRRTFFRRLGHGEESKAVASFDGERLSLPSVIDAFAQRSLNEISYLWIAAYAAFDPDPPEKAADPLVNDILRLRHNHRVAIRVLAACPGLRPVYRRLCSATLEQRSVAKLTANESDVEAAIRLLLSDELAGEESSSGVIGSVTGENPDISDIRAPAGYHPFKPVLVWPERLELQQPTGIANRHSEAGSGSTAESRDQRKRAARKKSDQANRRDSLILNRFETILSWTDFLNLNRRIEDDDEATARKAAEDADELGITDVDKTPATRLAFDLDMAPQDIDRTRLTDGILYDEWDYRGGHYLRDYARVLPAEAEACDLEAIPRRSREASRRLNAVRRQFEALRPKRRSLPRQPDGDELDLDALVASVTDIAVTGNGSDRIYRRNDNNERDLSVATLIDISRSTESAVGERMVIDIARESLTALGYGLAATGDAHSIYSFSSLRRDKVFVNRVKAFSEAMGPGVEARITALRPGFYTRLGSAVRYMTSQLLDTESSRRLLLVLTDGKPNDLDHYEGRYGVEDSRMAVREARRHGLAVFGIAIDKRAEQYVPRIFGQNGYAIVSRPEKLMEALPQIYRHLVT